MNKIRFLSFLVAGMMAVAVAQSANAQTTVIYDSISDGTRADGTVIDRTLQGRPVVTGREVTGNLFFNNMTDLGSVVTGLDFYVSATNASLTTYQSIRVNVQFWNEFGNEFAPDYLRTPAGGLQTQDFVTSGSLPTNVALVLSGGTTGDIFDLYLVSLTFAQPITLADNALNAVAFNIQGNTGSGFTNTTNLSTFRTRGNGFLAGGTNIANGGGYLVNQSGRTDFNFTNDGNAAAPNDLQQPPNPATSTVNEALGVRLFGATAVPEAGSIALLALGAGVPLAGVVLRRRQK